MADKKIFANTGPTKPSVPKSAFDLSHTNNGTYRIGRAYPILCYEAPAGSSFRIKPYTAFQMHPMAFPIQTNVRCHMSFYKIPFRILWRHYKEFVGQHDLNGEIATPQTALRIPYVKRPIGWHKTGSLADYMGLPSERVTVDTGKTMCKRGRVFRVPYFVNGVRVDYNSSYLFDRNGDFIDMAHWPARFNGMQASFTVDDKFYTHLAMYYGIHNFTGDKVVIRLHTTDANFSASKFVGAQQDEGVRLVVGLTDKSANNTLCLLPANGEVNYNNSFMNLTTDNTAVTLESSTASGVYVYKVEITLKREISELLAAFSYDAFACLGLFYRNSALPDSEPLASRNLHDVSNLKIENEKDGDEALTYTAVLSQSFYLSWELEYDSNKPVSVDGSYMFSSTLGVNDGKPFIPISALPFRAYEFIRNFFFRNERVTPFTKDGHPVFNEFLTNDGDGADDKTPVDFWNVPYEYDLFTTCVKTPQFGNAPLVGITTNDKTASLLMQNVSVTGSAPGNYAIEVDTVNDRIVQITNYDEIADKPGVKRLQEAIQYGISINDFRNVNALQRFQERYMKAGTKYQNIVYEFFGTNPPIGEEFPEYIGGTTTSINVSKVMSTASTENAELGDYVGNGTFAGKGKTIRCFCAEQSYIIGIMYFTCTPAYSQMLPRHFSKSDLLDFYNPQFANLGLQPVYRHQLAPLQLDVEEVGEVFGYNRPFSEYVSMQDEVHGDFRTNMADYLMQRIFANKPELSEQFINIYSKDVTNVFINRQDDDKIYGQIYFDMRAKLPIPRFAVPRII